MQGAAQRGDPLDGGVEVRRVQLPAVSPLMPVIQAAKTTNH